MEALLTPPDVPPRPSALLLLVKQRRRKRHLEFLLKIIWVKPDAHTRMYRYQLYESKFKFYVIKEHIVKKEFNILKINKSASAELELEGTLKICIPYSEFDD